MTVTKLRLALVAILLPLSLSAFADDTDDEIPTAHLGTLKVTTTQAKHLANLLGKRANVSDQTVRADELKKRATTLGDALDGELGIHSNQFGGVRPLRLSVGKKANALPFCKTMPMSLIWLIFHQTTP